METQVDKLVIKESSTGNTGDIIIVPDQTNSIEQIGNSELNNLENIHKNVQFTQLDQTVKQSYSINRAHSVFNSHTSQFVSNISRTKSASTTKKTKNWFSEPVSKTQLTYFVDSGIEGEIEEKRPPKSYACGLM